MGSADPQKYLRAAGASSHRRGFTLAELLVVLSIIGLLAAAVFANLTSARDKARIAAGKAFSGTIERSMRHELIGEWHFNTAGAGDAVDTSGSGNDGVLFNGAAKLAEEECEGLDLGGCLALDGGNDYVALPLSFGAGALPEVTVCAWVKSSSFADQMVVSFDRSEVLRLALDEDGVTGVAWDTHGASNVHDLRPGNTYTDDKWHYLCGWFNAVASPDKKLFVDGALIADSGGQVHGGESLGQGQERPATFGFIGVGSEASVFNGARGPTDYFDGLIDEVRIYSAALTAREIGALYAQQAPARRVANERTAK